MGRGGGPPVSSRRRHGRVSAKALHANSIGAMVKRACRAAGHNAKEFAGHSLRAGLATQTAANGVPERLIMRQTRHRSVTTLLYIRQGSLFRENAAAESGIMRGHFGRRRFQSTFRPQVPICPSEHPFLEDKEANAFSRWRWGWNNIRHLRMGFPTLPQLRGANLTDGSPTFHTILELY